MLSIGQFSRACHVSVKTLRHYEKVGLLLSPGWMTGQATVTMTRRSLIPCCSFSG